MENYSISLKTDKRVSEIIKYFLEYPGWLIVQEIDSSNYGEGYDLEYQGILVRIYDDIRSDEVSIRINKTGGDWNEVFQQVVKDMEGQASINFEIDRLNMFSENQKMKVVSSIKEVLINSGDFTESSFD